MLSKRMQALALKLADVFVTAVQPYEHRHGARDVAHIMLGIAVANVVELGAHPDKIQAAVAQFIEAAQDGRRERLRSRMPPAQA